MGAKLAPIVEGAGIHGRCASVRQGYDPERTRDARMTEGEHSSSAIAQACSLRCNPRVPRLDTRVADTLTSVFKQLEAVYQWISLFTFPTL